MCGCCMEVPAQFGKLTEIQPVPFLVSSSVLRTWRGDLQSQTCFPSHISVKLKKV
ncbi:hypothetical protein XENTR_v10013986 [Xenopus tropicalis]|nr:hypothetical protein XENTR_v10013986 [Xenopus tropicalis]